MQDRPTYDELLAAIEHFLDTEIVPNLPGSRGFHARISANAIRIIRRELELEESHLAAEWSGLDELLGLEGLPQDRAALKTELRRRNEALCSRIRLAADEDAAFIRSVMSHVRSVVADKLRVTDPELLERSQPSGQ
jgi:hypothetical protein